MYCAVVAKESEMYAPNQGCVLNMNCDGGKEEILKVAMMETDLTSLTEVAVAVAVVYTTIH